jgi:hypothetical protein
VLPGFRGDDAADPTLRGPAIAPTFDRRHRLSSVGQEAKSCAGDLRLRRSKAGRDDFATRPRNPITVVLDGVRGNYNLGAIFRLCDAFLVERLVVCGTDPSEVDVSGQRALTRFTHTGVARTRAGYLRRYRISCVWWAAGGLYLEGRIGGVSDISRKREQRAARAVSLLGWL